MKTQQFLLLLLLAAGASCSTPVVISQGLETVDPEKVVEIKMLRAERDGDSLRVVLAIKNLTEDRDAELNFGSAVLFAEGETLAQFQAKPGDFSKRRPERVDAQDASMAFVQTVADNKNPKQLLLRARVQQTRVLNYSSLPLDFAPLEIHIIDAFTIKNANSNVGKPGKLVIPLKGK